VAGAAVAALLIVGAVQAAQDPYDKELPAEERSTWASTITVLSAPLFGSAMGVFAYGEWTGHSGGFWRTVLGAGAGELLAMLIVTAYSKLGFNNSRVNEIAWSSLLLLPPAGAVTGYHLSLDEEEDESATQRGQPVRLTPQVLVGPLPISAASGTGRAWGLAASVRF